jgi:acyl-coenzyme A synthetase/AMP-(fatty) acid ligase
MTSREELRARLTGSGGPFEIVVEPVLGEPMAVFKNRPRSLRALLEQSAAHGAREYLIEGARRITYAENLRLVASVAAALRERFGVRKGDRVAVLAENRVEWPLSFWATQCLGGVTAALNGWWTADETAYGVADCEPKLLIGTGSGSRAPARSTCPCSRSSRASRSCSTTHPMLRSRTSRSTRTTPP